MPTQQCRFNRVMLCQGGLLPPERMTCPKKLNVAANTVVNHRTWTCFSPYNTALQRLLKKTQNTALVAYIWALDQDHEGCIDLFVSSDKLYVFIGNDNLFWPGKDAKM